jgi:hypothetical protein
MNEPDAASRHVGKRIETVRHVEANGAANGALCVVFEDGAQLQFSDAKQECCERRYMTCDDDLQSFTGARFVGWEVLNAPDRDHDRDEHEVQFLHVRTDGGAIVCETHNEHSGAYGGFNVVVREVG